MNGTVTSDEAMGLLGPLAADLKQRNWDAAVSAARTMRQELVAFLANPEALNALAKLRAKREQCEVKIAKAVAELAKAKADNAQAEMDYNIAAQIHGRELQRLRMACFGPVERDAIARLTAVIEGYQQSGEHYAASAVLRALCECRNDLNAMSSGARDPAENIDAVVDDAITTAAKAFRVAQEEAAERARLAAIEARRQKIHKF